MTRDTPDWLEAALMDLPDPAPADDAFLARLKTIPARVAQQRPVPRGWAQVRIDLAPFFKPVRLALEGGVLAAALVAGLMLGGLSQPDRAEPEIDLTDYLVDAGWEELL